MHSILRNTAKTFLPPQLCSKHIWGTSFEPLCGLSCADFKYKQNISICHQWLKQHRGGKSLDIMPYILFFQAFVQTPPLIPAASVPYFFHSRSKGWLTLLLCDMGHSHLWTWAGCSCTREQGLDQKHLHWDQELCTSISSHPTSKNYAHAHSLSEEHSWGSGSPVFDRPLSESNYFELCYVSMD